MPRRRSCATSCRRRSRRARSVRRARDDVAEPHAGARIADGRGAEQDGARSTRAPRRPRASASSPPNSMRSSRASAHGCSSSRSSRAASTTCTWSPPRYDRKLTEQLARRNEVEGLKSLCDTLGTQVVDAQQKLDGVAAMQTRLVPITTQVATLTQSLEKSQQLRRVRQAGRGGHSRADRAPDRAGRAGQGARRRGRRAAEAGAVASATTWAAPPTSRKSC